MADILSRQQRSRVMAAVRSRGNKNTELKLVAILRAAGITGWRRHLTVVGRPDFVFRRYRLTIFVDGCFWHGCRWHCRMPKSRKSFWTDKIARNRARDRKVRRLLYKDGWKVLRFWEHTLYKPTQVAVKIQTMLASARIRR